MEAWEMKMKERLSRIHAPSGFPERRRANAARATARSQDIQAVTDKTEGRSPKIGSV
jgi:hypothetical protein